MNRPADILPVLCSVVVGDQHVRPDGKPHEHRHDQLRQRGGRSHRRHRLMGRIPADHDQIRRIEQQLQNSGQHQRYGKDHDFAEQRPPAHVYLVFVFRTGHFITIRTNSLNFHALDKYRQRTGKSQWNNLRFTAFPETGQPGYPIFFDIPEKHAVLVSIESHPVLRRILCSTTVWTFTKSRNSA